MTAVNAGIHELAGVRLPLQPYSGGHAVFMYSTATDGNVTLQLKEPDDLDRRSLAAMLARLQDDATFSISYQDTDILSDGSIDVLLGTGSNNSLQDTGGNESATTTFDLFDSSSGPDLTLSPQTFTNSAEAFINDNSNSLGVPADNDPVSSTDDKKVQGTTGEIVKLAVKRVRPKAASPNRQGPQQCQVCAKVFGNASALAKHKLTHSDERKYVCTICGKAFKRQDHLNGHMLTHRNKKPYECKAEGCGKSYCDARSLRRHTENHHNTCVNATTMSPAQGAASGDAASPHGASCIQYAPPPNTTTSGKSQLQQLLASEPAKSLNGDNNDGLTKQQLDLIHQIMEQTQRQSQTTTTTKSSKQSSKPVAKTPVRVQKVWSSTNQQMNSQKNTGSPPNVQIKVSSSSSPTSTNKSEPKPVECNLCHRKFKNIPALNGHMRLHGGYFKKDSDNKKNEKKDAAGPPLQTASISVRALIEEKIINKRITNPNNTNNSDDSNQKTAPPLFPLTTSTTSNDLEPKVTSFVVPAPPQQIAEKSRRHSDTETFTIPRPPSAQETENLDLLLKREKVFKRTTSDPGQNSPIIQFQTGNSFSLTYQSDDGEFISPNLQEEVFTQEGMLLQTVNTPQLSSLHFKSENLLQDKSDNQLQDINLHDYASLHDSVGESPSYQSTHSVNQDLQAVLDSPLPDTLAEFSAYHSSGNLDLPSPSYQNQSPAQYSSSPHASLTAQSPLQSPLIRHDSPGFAYPTPPASHEGQSPCFGQNTMLPMVSPKQNDFTQIIERDEDPPQASSPLSAAFFTSTMSSSAAVEEALEEVLPGENIGNDELYSSLANSPSPHSPLSVGLTPVASPLSNIPNSTSSPQNNHQSAQNTISFPLTQHYTLQTHMLPNSDDPLLSSSSKDFATRRKFEFNGVPLKIISTGEQIDFNNTNLTGILVESNGEIKFIHTGSNFQGKNIYLTGAPLITTQRESNHNNQKHEVVQIKQNIQIQRPKESQDNTKHDEILHDVFVSPNIIPGNPGRPSRKRPRTEPLQFPVIHKSRLRPTRSKPQGATSYTPFPILNPNRSGSGLFANLKHRSAAENGDEFMNSWSNESIPESDSTPHVNIGQQFQCNIPPLNKGQNRFTQEKQHENLLWDPGILQCTDNEIEMYLDFACCAAIPGGGRNQEYALHLLHMCNGNIQDAMLKLMQPTPLLPADHPLLGYTYSESDNWNATETEIFNHAIQKYDKDFNLIAQEVGTKNIKQCVQFYYMWKKVCVEEYKLLKHVREKKQELKMELVEEKLYPDAKLLGIVDVGSPMPNQEQRNFICEFLDCSASFNSRAALNGHIRIHGGNTRNSPTPAHSMDGRLSTIITTPCHTDSSEDYPCKICGKVFSKIKSRSAHMKSHRPQDAEPIRKKEKETVTSTMVDPSPTSFNT